MSDLKLPVIKESLPPPVLSMNRYLDFVEFYRRYLLKPKTYKAQKKADFQVGVRFQLKP